MFFGNEVPIKIIKHKHTATRYPPIFKKLKSILIGCTVVVGYSRGAVQTIKNTELC